MDISNFYGIITGLATFLIIGIFHPIVVKWEYRWGTKCWWVFLIVGVASITSSPFMENPAVSAIVSVLGFTSLWTIKELFEQTKRVQKGWFPENPKRKHL